MKTLYYVLWIVSCLLTLPALGQPDRPAYWVHGLDDDGPDRVWNNYNALFAAERRLGPTSNAPYTTSQGVTGFANW